LLGFESFASLFQHVRDSLTGRCSEHTDNHFVTHGMRVSVLSRAIKCAGAAKTSPLRAIESLVCVAIPPAAP
jgi:hypothetical protein